MSRNNTQALHSIRMMCRMQQVDEKVLYDRSRLILSIYRDVCWSTMGRAEEVYDDFICTCGTSLDGALITTAKKKLLCFLVCLCGAMQFPCLRSFWQLREKIKQWVMKFRKSDKIQTLFLLKVQLCRC